MGSWRKVGAFLGLVPEDGRPDEYGEDYHDGQYHEGGYSDGYEAARSPEYAEGYEATREHARQSPYQPGPRGGADGYESPMTQGALAVAARPEVRRDYAESTGAVRPVTVKLTGFGEARVIGEKFREGKPVILDMTDMDDAGARRLVDFAAGLAFALRGSIDKVTTKVFMLLPPDTEMSDLPAYEPEHAGYPAPRQAYAAGRGGR